ncbi:MAG: hypothetical protein KIH62_000090 [Candidatus Kerfeldbacteria bacterium]|nr:hypothetical protein [Candidatus Kerfeldbacteria bacterium]
MVRSNDSTARRGGKYFRDLDLLPWYAEKGLIPGGEESQKWLAENGFRDVDGKPNARKAWEFVENKLQIKWSWDGGKEGKGDHYIAWDYYPRILGPQAQMMQPSLADLVRHCRGDITLKFVPHTRDEHERHMLPLLVQGDAGKLFSELIRDHGHKPPKGRVLNAVSSWLERASAAEESTVHFFVCPDWETCDGRYTFDSLGEGIGLVAHRALGILPKFFRFTQEAGLPNVRFKVAIGDFEGDSVSACQRIGIDATEFRRRCRLSQQAFQAELERRCPQMLSSCTFPFATELAGGQGRWGAILDCARQCVGDGLENAMRLTPKEVDEIVNARRSLYERWYGEGCDSRAILTGQLPEYGAMGLVARDSTNPLIVGVDHAVMAHGFQIGGEEPLAVVYLRHSDY